MARSKLLTPEERARKRAKELTGLLWHIGAFLVVNAFLWLQDLVGGGGLEWAFWVTIPWGLGLAFHALAYFLEERGMEERKYRQYLEEERKREAQLH